MDLRGGVYGLSRSGFIGGVKKIHERWEMCPLKCREKEDDEQGKKKNLKVLGEIY